MDVACVAKTKYVVYRPSIVPRVMTLTFGLIAVGLNSKLAIKNQKQFPIEKGAGSGFGLAGPRR